MDLAARSWLYRIHLIACIRFPVYRSGGLSWRERVAPADCRPPHISWIGRQALPLRCGLFDSRAADGHARVQGRRRDWHERLPSFARHLPPIFKPWPFWTPSTPRYSSSQVFRGGAAGRHVRAAASPRSIQVWPTQAPIAPPPVRSSSLWWCSDAWAKADNGYMSCVQKAIKTLNNGASAARKPCFLS